MDDTIETLMVGVRADTATFAQDAASMQAVLQGSLGTGADKAGSLIEASLLKAVQSGKLGFDDLGKTALAVLNEIAAQAVKSGLNTLFGGSDGGSGGSGGGGLLSFANGLLGSLLGSPGRATGGPVSPNRPYWVGERGPELFVPTSAGSMCSSWPPVRKTLPSPSSAAGRSGRCSHWRPDRTPRGRWRR